jgi:ABC-type uncharacterized transport system auxiliary subunit
LTGSAAAVAAALALGGCLELGKPFPEKISYALEARRDGERRAPAQDFTVSVRQFSVSPAYRSREFVYLREGHRYESDFYNEFFTPIGPMVAEAVRKWLEDSGLFATVIAPGSSLAARYAIEGWVRRIHGDFRDPERPLAVIELQVGLIRDDDSGPVAVRQWTYLEEVAIAAASPQELVKGWDQGLERILRRLEGDLGQLGYRL